MEYTVNGRTLRYQVSNKTRPGEDRVMLDHARDLTRGQSWHEAGYAVERLFERDDDFLSFVSACRELLVHCWRDAGLNVPPNFMLDQYHRLADDASKHLSAIERTKLLPLGSFPIPIYKITDRVSDMLNVKVAGHNPYDGQRVFHFRVVRPSSADNNPLHRDVWLEDYADCINLYIPIAGSTAHSSLIILPGSHRWPESRLTRTVDGAMIGDTRFNVPAVAAIHGDFEAVRPDPGLNEFLLFSPYLIHGGSANFNEDQTRISIELRLWAV